MIHRHRISIAVIAACLCWLGYWGWHYTSSCRLLRMGGARAITCHWDSVQDGTATVVSRTTPLLPTLRLMAANAIGIPACVILAGIVLWWVIGKLRARTG